MQKIIAIIMMSFASLVLLAHAVVPHHHHDNVACFVLPSEGNHDHDACSHDDADHQEKHDADPHNDCCLLNDILAIIPGTYKIENLNWDHSVLLNNSSYFLISFLIPEMDQGQQLTYFDFRQRPFLAFSYEAYATQCLGMRAPPSC